jgi:hypothetical protein
LLLGLAGAYLWTSRSDTRELDIRSTPAGATVMLDGRAVGETPLTVSVDRASPVVLQLQRRGYEAVTQQVAAGSTPERVVATWASLGTLARDTRPGGAADGVPRDGARPLVVGNLWIGEPHTIVVSAPGHRARTERLEFEEGSSRTLAVELEPAEGATPPTAVALAPDPDPAEVTPPGSSSSSTSAIGRGSSRRHRPGSREEEPEPSVPVGVEPPPPPPPEPARPAPAPEARRGCHRDAAGARPSAAACSSAHCGPASASTPAIDGFIDRLGACAAPNRR